MRLLNLFRNVITAFSNEPFRYVIAKIWRRISNSLNSTKQIHYSEYDVELSLTLKDAIDFTENSKVPDAPFISFITPVYNPEPTHLLEMLDSVYEQSSSNWELCIHDDGSHPHIVDILKAAQSKDVRIKLSLGEKNQGIVTASNKAIKQSSGSYIAFLDHDDRLHPMTVMLLLKALSENPKARLIYTNEDSIDVKGFIKSSIVKLPFGQNTLRSVNYINHLTVIEKRLGDSIGWLRSEFEGAQDFDLLLRISETIEPQSILHLPHRLYHWRQAESSISKNSWAKEYVKTSAKKALDQHLERIGTTLISQSGIKQGTFKLEDTAEFEPLVLFEFNCHSDLDGLNRSLKSVLQVTRYMNYKIILNKEIQSLIDSSLESSYLEGKIIEKAAYESTDEYLVCVISKPITVSRSDWLKQLVIYHQISFNDIVAPIVLYANIKVMCEGLFNINGKLTNIFKNRDSKIFLNYFAALPKDTNGIYNICYLRGKSRYRINQTIIVNPYSEVILPVQFDIESCSVIETS